MPAFSELVPLHATACSTKTINILFLFYKHLFSLFFYHSALQHLDTAMFKRVVILLSIITPLHKSLLGKNASRHHRQRPGQMVCRSRNSCCRRALFYQHQGRRLKRKRLGSIYTEQNPPANCDFISSLTTLFAAGAAMLFIGLCWEAYEGGIKKDPVTFSYLFVTAGLSFMTLIFFSIICDYYRCQRSTAFLVRPGQNPMMAYVANDLLIFPILQMTGIINFFSIFAHSPFGAFMQGVVATALAVAVTMLFTHIRCIWRT